MKNAGVNAGIFCWKKNCFPEQIIPLPSFLTHLFPDFAISTLQNSGFLFTFAPEIPQSQWRRSTILIIT